MPIPKSLKIILLTCGVIVLLTVSLFLFLSHWLKQKMISDLEENTEFKVQIGELSLGMNSATMTSFEMTPKLDKDSSQLINQYQKDWVTTKVNDLQFSGINWYDILVRKRIEIERMTITQPDIYIYRDNSLPDKNQYKALPAKLLRNTDLRFTIKAVELVQGIITYEKKEGKSIPPVSIVFNNAMASITSLSTDSLFVSENPLMEVNIQADMLDSIKTEVSCTINLQSPKDEFVFKGNIKSFNGVILNSFLRPLSNVEVTSGYIRSIHFAMNANEEIAIGKLDMDYQDLKLNILSKESPGEKSNLKTFLGNIFIRDKDKEKIHEAKPTGEIRYERRKDRFIFNYWYCAVRAGIVSSVSTTK